MNYRFSKAQNRLVFRYVLLILATNPYQVSYLNTAWLGHNSN
jgi:hypothetical protein